MQQASPLELPQLLVGLCRGASPRENIDTSISIVNDVARAAPSGNALSFAHDGTPAFHHHSYPKQDLTTRRRRQNLSGTQHSLIPVLERSEQPFFRMARVPAEGG